MKDTIEQQANQLWGTYATLENPDEQEKFWQTYQGIVRENQTTFFLQRISSPTLSSDSSIRLETVYNPADWVNRLIRLSLVIGSLSILVSFMYDWVFLFLFLLMIFISVIFSYTDKRINTVEIHSTYLRVNRKLSSNQIIIPWAKIQDVRLKNRVNPLYASQILTLKTVDKKYKLLLFLPARDVEELMEKLAQKGLKVIG